MKMIKTTWFAVAGMLLTGALTFVPGCFLFKSPGPCYPGEHQATVIVVDDGMPVEGAEVIFHDADGRFVVERVPPGPAGVGIHVRVGGNTWTSQQSERVEVKAGQTVRVALGGKGRPVIGRVALPSGLSKVRLSSSRGSIRTKREPPPWPDGWQSMDAEAKRQWYSTWSQSEEGKAFFEAAREARATVKHFSLGLEEDGSFRVEDVPAGAYQLSLSIHKPGGSGMWSGRRPASAVARLEHEFIVPDMPGGRSDEPLDLGTLDLTLVQPRASAGSGTRLRQAGSHPAAAGSGTAPVRGSLIGKPLPKLDAFNFNFRLTPGQLEGHSLLICFWDTEQRPSRHCIRELTKKADKLAAKGVAVFTVHARTVDPDVLWKWLKTNNIRCSAGYVSQDPNVARQQRKAWGIRALPWLILTDNRRVVRAEGFGLAELDENLNDRAK